MMSLDGVLMFCVLELARRTEQARPVLPPAELSFPKNVVYSDLEP